MHLSRKKLPVIAENELMARTIIYSGSYMGIPMTIDEDESRPVREIIEDVSTIEKQ